MNRERLADLVRKASCRVLGAEDASNDAQRAVLAAMIGTCEDADATILCEPSLARRTTRPPDVVFVDLVAGLHVIEVKGVTLDQIESIDAGGQFRIRYGDTGLGKNPFAQVRSAMFDIKDTVERNAPAEIVIPFKYWVMLPSIEREQWLSRWGADCFCPPELLFADDLTDLVHRLRCVGQDALTKQGLPCWPTDQVQSIWRAFGDSSVLFPRPEERQPRRVCEGTLGEYLDEASETYKALSDEQQKLSMMGWESGPRLVRGVAGSGKTIVLANNLARRIQRVGKAPPELFETQRAPRFAAVCFNRTLAPFLRKKIDVAFRQRTGKALPPYLLDVWSYNRLMWNLSQKGLWRYQKFDSGDDAQRAVQYLRDLQYVKQYDPSTFDQHCFDAIYVDEGQDFLEEDFQLLKELCRTDEEGQPSLFVFYDDAQNLYGRPRPNWSSLGLRIVGRSHVMTECFRNTRQIVEVAFNVLYGSFASEAASVPTKAFGDITTLEEKGLLEQQQGVWKVRFARREGMSPKVTVSQGRQCQTEAMIERLRWLIEDQQVRPEDIHVLVYYRNQVDRLQKAIEGARIPSVQGIHVATSNKDELLHQRGYLSISTVASAKGYDAYCVLIADGDEVPTGLQGRASFYVACTRAIEYLEVFASSRSGLVAEMQQAIAALERENTATADSIKAP